jgi:hypothetical protein
MIQATWPRFDCQQKSDILFENVISRLFLEECVTVDGIGIGYWIYWHICMHHSELQAITVVSLISTLYKSPQHLLSLFPACCVFKSSSLATASNNGDASASSTHVVTVRQISHNWTLFFTAGLSTLNWTGLPSLLSLPHRAQLSCQLSTDLSHWPTNYFTSLHFTSINWAALSQPGALTI